MGQHPVEWDPRGWLVYIGPGGARHRVQQRAQALTTAKHAATHQDGGPDEINVTGLSGLLADPQTPLAHAPSHKEGGADQLRLHELADPTASVEFAQQQALQFRIENRTSDPGAPAEGQVWLRTDL